MPDVVPYTLPGREASPVLMGILNVTPDSFSDGGRFVDVCAAVAHGVAMAREGAGLIDVGGESTRPGAQRVDAGEQCARVVEVIGRLRAALDAAALSSTAISIDTTRASVASAALDAGASVVNDVSAGREDDAMFALVARRGAAMVLMHMLGEPGTMQESPVYDDVVGEVLGFLHERVEAAKAAGVLHEQIAIDPGIGFGKTVGHNLALLAGLERFVATGYPVLLGASRKRFIAQVEEGAGYDSLCPTGNRLGGTLATTVLGFAAGVRLFRVHAVGANRQALSIVAAVGRAAENH